MERAVLQQVSMDRAHNITLGLNADLLSMFDIDRCKPRGG